MDIGCGNGAYTRYFFEQGSNIIGIDTSGEQIRLSKKLNEGPEYVQTSGQDYINPNSFENLFANMVICNIPTEEELQKFFQTAYDNATENGHLFVTNVSPEFQKTCDTKPLVHTYPTEVKDGSEFEISLKTTKGTIGPFKNYHWSQKKLNEVATNNGWVLIESTYLNSESTDQDIWPTYIMYEYYKK